MPRRPLPVIKKPRAGRLAARGAPALPVSAAASPADAAPAGVAQLLPALAQAQDAMASMERFVYLCSHDLREPLRMITGFLGLMQRRSQGMSATQTEYLGLALGGAIRLDAMLEGLLRHSRLSRMSSYETCAVAPLAREVQLRLGSARGLPESVWTTASLPEVWADPQQLDMLLHELLANALGFGTPGGTPEVSLTAQRTTGAWRLAIADRGIGIPAADRARVFEVFAQLNSASGGQGVGIGLALCAKIVAQHRGRIWIEDNPPDRRHPAGGGTVVLVELPDRAPPL